MQRTAESVSCVQSDHSALAQDMARCSRRDALPWLGARCVARCAAYGHGHPVTLAVGVTLAIVLASACLKAG